MIRIVSEIVVRTSNLLFTSSHAKRLGVCSVDEGREKGLDRDTPSYVSTIGIDSKDSTSHTIPTPGAMKRTVLRVPMAHFCRSTVYLDQQIQLTVLYGKHSHITGIKCMNRIIETS